MTTNSNFAYIRGSSASNLDWSRIRFFTPSEFPEKELDFLNKYVVEELDKVREGIGIPIFISPVKGGVVRFDPTSKSLHASNENSPLAQAVDVFIPQSQTLSLPTIITTVLGLSRFRGLGIYFDTSYEGVPCIMLHLDLRHIPLLWFCPPKEQGIPRKYLYSSVEKSYFKSLEMLWDFFHLEREEKKLLQS